MESTLHRQLKERYGTERGGQVEVTVAGYRIDAVGPDGELVEVQTASLSPLRAKLGRLLAAGHAVRVVKPILHRRRIIRRQRLKGPDSPSRLSPRRGSVLDVFEDLVGIACLLAEPALRFDVLELDACEWRLDARRRTIVLDRALLNVERVWSIDRPDDLWSLIPGAVPERFTTRELAEALDRPAWFAQKVAYCLRHSGAARQVGKARHHQLYERVSAGTIAEPATASP